MPDGALNGDGRQTEALELGRELGVARVECTGAEAQRVRELLGDRIVDGVMPLPTLVIKGVKT